MSTLIVEEVSADEFPPVVRGGGSGRVSEEREQIRSLIAGGSQHRIPVASLNEFNSLSQRIRSVAKQMGVKVEVVNRQGLDGFLYFRQKPATEVTETETAE